MEAQLMLPIICNGLFPPTETEMETDSFPNGYIVLCRTFSTGSDPDTDPCMETFPDGYCTHFRDGSPSQTSLHEIQLYLFICFSIFK